MNLVKGCFKAQPFQLARGLRQAAPDGDVCGLRPARGVATHSTSSAQGAANEGEPWRRCW